MLGCICSVADYDLLLELLLRCMLLATSWLFRNEKSSISYVCESTWKLAKPTQVHDVTSSENINAVNSKAESSRTCVDIHLSKNWNRIWWLKLVKSLMVPSKKLTFLGYFYCHPSKYMCLHVPISFLLKLKAASDILRTDAAELIIIFPVSMTARNYCNIVVIPWCSDLGLCIWFSWVSVNCSNTAVQWQILKSDQAEVVRHTVKVGVSCGRLFSYVLALLFWWYRDERYSWKISWGVSRVKGQDAERFPHGSAEGTHIVHFIKNLTSKEFKICKRDTNHRSLV